MSDPTKLSPTIDQYQRVIRAVFTVKKAMTTVITEVLEAAHAREKDAKGFTQGRLFMALLRADQSLNDALRILGEAVIEND